MRGQWGWKAEHLALRRLVLCTLPIELRGPFRGRFKNLRQPPDELVEQLKEAMGRLSAGLEI